MFRQLTKFGAVLLLLCTSPGHADAQQRDYAAAINQIVGEDNRYAIDLFIFSGLAEGRLRFAGTDRQGVYRAELVGHTLGVVSWLIGERTQTYTSIMESDSDGSLRTIEHVSRIAKYRWGQWQYSQRRFRYDYMLGKVSEEKTYDGVTREKVEHDIPKGSRPVDMLTAFYNLRAGVYGTLERGAHMSIPTCSGGKFTEMEVDVQTPEKQYSQKFFPAYGLLLRIKLDPLIFDIGNGILYVWFDDSGVPRRGLLQDLAGLGDARGYMDKENL